MLEQYTSQAQVPREQAHHPGQLGDAEDVIVGDVAEVGMAEEGQGVMLAERIEGDGSLDNLADLAVRPARAFGGERGDEVLVALVAVGGIDHRAQEPLGRAPRSGRLGRHAHRGEDLAQIALESLPVGVRDPAWVELRPSDQLVVRCVHAADSVTTT